MNENSMPEKMPGKNVLPSNEPSSDLPPESDSERIEKLTWLVESLREQLSLAEARVVQLTAVVSESAEDLQPYDGSFHKPSSITNITYNPPTGQIQINGTTIVPRSAIRAEAWELMEAYARQVNQTNAVKRKKAGLPEPEAEG